VGSNTKIRIKVGGPRQLRCARGEKKGVSSKRRGSPTKKGDRPGQRSENDSSMAQEVHRAALPETPRGNSGKKSAMERDMLSLTQRATSQFVSCGRGSPGERSTGRAKRPRVGKEGCRAGSRAEHILSNSKEKVGWERSMTLNPKKKQYKKNIIRRRCAEGGRRGG